MTAIVRVKDKYSTETAALALEGWEALAPGPDWVNALRQRSRTDLAKKGLPTRQLERWKYTDLPAALKDMDIRFSKADIDVSGFSDTAFSVQRLEDILEEAPDWIREMAETGPPEAERFNDMMLWSAADAFLRDGLVLDIPAGACCAEPLEITTAAREGGMYAPRMFFRIGAGADITLVEYHLGKGAYWDNRVTQIRIAGGAKLRHYRIQENSLQSACTHNTMLEIEAGGTYESFTLTAGARLSRNQVYACLKGETAQCNLFGLNLLSGEQVADSTWALEHAGPGGVSVQACRSLLAGRSRGVFQGRALVAPGAQKTDASQLSNALLLSPQAEMNTKPELEIYADDVQCAHGATIGKPDAQQLFYLRSRGIPEHESLALLAGAFAEDIICRIGSADIQIRVREQVRQWLEKHYAE